MCTKSEHNLQNNREMKTKEEILIWALNNRCKYESSKEMDYDTHLAIMDAMEAYHEAKMKEVTDKDIHDVSNSAEYTRGYRDGWRDCCKDVKEFG